MNKGLLSLPVKENAAAWMTQNERLYDRINARYKPLV